MKRKGIPKKRIGPELGSWERSIRKRQFKVMEFGNFTEQPLNAADKSAYGYMSASLCGIKEEIKEKKYEKEVMKRASSVIYLAERSRERLAPDFESAGVKPFVIRPAQQKTDDYERKEKGKDRSKTKRS